MRSKKRLLVSILLIGLLIITGCGGGQQAEQSTDQPEETTSQPEESSSQDQAADETEQAEEETGNQDPQLTAADVNWETATEEEVNKAVEKGADINAVDQQEKTPLMKAAEAGNLPVVKAVVEKEAAINKQDQTGKTALMYAAMNGHQQVIDYLLANNIEPKLKDDDQQTAFDYLKHYMEENKFSPDQLEIYKTLKQATEE